MDIEPTATVIVNRADFSDLLLNMSGVCSLLLTVWTDKHKLPMELTQMLNMVPGLLPLWLAGSARRAVNDARHALDPVLGGRAGRRQNPCDPCRIPHT